MFLDIRNVQIQCTSEHTEVLVLHSVSYCSYQYPQEVNFERKSYEGSNLESYHSSDNQGPQWNRYSNEHRLSESWPIWNNVRKVYNEEYETQKYAKKGNDVENSESLPYWVQLKKALNEQNEKLVSNKLQYGNQYSSNQDINARFWTPLTHKYAYQLNQDFPYAHDYSYQQSQK